MEQLCRNLKILTQKICSRGMGRGSGYKVEGGTNKSMLQVLASEVAPAVLIGEGQKLADGTWYLSHTPAIPSLGLIISHSFPPHPASWDPPCSDVDNLSIRNHHDSTLEQYSQ
jgi:hypothetical protein